MTRVVPSATVPLNAWTYVTFTYDGTNGTFYLNGAQNGAAAGSMTEPSTFAADIGQNPDPTAPNIFPGKIDEVRVSNIVHSADWIATEYNNQSSPSTFYTVGSTTATITNLSPSAGGIGASATITGTNFGTTQGTVTFNGTQAAVTSWSNTSIVTTVPAGASTGSVIVHTNGVDSNGSTFVITSGTTWPNGYAYRRTITIDHTKVPNTDLTSFPVLISSTFADLATTSNGGQVTSSNGYDIVFSSDSGGATQLAFERESYSVTTGAVIFWVNVPILSHTADTIIYLFYANPLVMTDQSNSAAVWDSNYVGVWHVPNGSTLSAADSSSNENNGTINGQSGNNMAVAGEIDGAATFDGSTQTITHSDNSSLRLAGSRTLSAWVKLNSLPSSGNEYAIVSKESESNGSGITNYLLSYTNFNGVSGWSDSLNDGTNQSFATYTTTPSTGVWYHVAGVWNASSGIESVYVNGAQQAANIPGLIPDANAGSTFAIGADASWGGGLGGYADASIDEVRVSNTARSSDWIATDYNNQSNPSAFYSIGSANTNSGGGGSAPTISSLSPTSGAVGATVTVTGTHFGTSQGSSTVTFGGTSATATSWGDTSIVAIVPNGATTGYVVVTVAGLPSNGVNFNAAPAITSLSPVLEAPGIPVTISGTNFGSSQGSSTLTFHGLNAVPTSWTDTSITTIVPTSATTGYLVVTVGGVPSNNELFVIVPTPIITSISPASGVAGTPVTINGANFGTTQGTSTVMLNGFQAVVTNWSGSTVVVNIPSSATTGNIVVTVGGVGSNGMAFTVTGPTITGLSSRLGAVGDAVTLYGFNLGSTQASSTVTFNGISATPTSWNNMSIVVPVPAGATTGSITVTVSSVPTSSTVFTVSSPDTITGLSITGPSNGTTVSTPYAAVTGTVTGSIAGVDPIEITCNSAGAKLTATNFSCNTPLSAGVNSITVTGTDSAGDTRTATVSVTLGMSTPISIQVTPPNVNMLVGTTQSFTAVDDQGTRRPDATWTVSDSTIASFVVGSPNVLLANAVGQVTLTASVGGVNAQTTVTVISGTSLSAGSVLWSSPSVSGFSAKQIVQAVPTADGPDLYSIETDSNNRLVRAFKGTGEQIWQSSLASSEYPSVGVGDSYGGLLIVDETNQNSSGTFYGTITDFDRQSGGQIWQYTTLGSGSSSISFGAVGLDGTVYVIEGSTPGGASESYVDLLDGATGNLKSRIELPTSLYYFHCPTETSTQYPGSIVGAGAVAPDGAFYMEVSNYEETVENDCEFAPVFSVVTHTSNLSLLRISPDGAAGFDSLNSGATPGKVIPDGQGGILAMWEESYAVVADIGTTGGGLTNLSIGNGSMVLGDNNTAFATDGNSVVALAVPGLQQTWTYTSTGGTLSFVAATSGGGVAVNDSQLGVIQLDSSGNAAPPSGTLQGAAPFRPGLPISISQDGTILNSWISDSNGMATALAGMDMIAAPSVYPGPFGAGQLQNRSVSTATVTVHYTPGSKSQADLIEFPPSQSCSQDLGLLDCTTLQFWHWNVEIAATVSDDASLWTPIQSVAFLVTGRWKDSLGILHSEGNYVKKPDGPDSTYVQKTAKQKSLFFIDSPGPSYYFDFLHVERVDSLTATLNFRSLVCNNSGICSVSKWHLKFVVDPGSMLDYGQSQFGFGSIPF